MTSATASDLCDFIDASPSPFHVCATAATRLRGAGFTEVHEDGPWPDAPGRYFVVRGGSLVAWAARGSASAGDSGPEEPARPFSIIGAHTDSPNLRVKQHPDGGCAGWRTVALEPYGGAWLHSWLDRDLGLSGRVTVDDGGGAAERLVRVDRPILRVPQLAIHLSEDRKGVHPDPQRHLDAVLGVDTHAAGEAPGGGAADGATDGADAADGDTGLIGLVAREAGLAPDAVLGFELMTHDLAPSGLVGADGDLVSAPRLDNQATCYAGLTALLDTIDGGQATESGRADPVLVLFDHEEVGSGSERGAQSELLPTVLERIVLARGGGREDFLRAKAGSLCVSGDMAHATHPNHPDRHEPRHRIAPGGGPVLKVNANLRYSSDAAGAAEFALACRRAGVPMQRYVHRADLPCGSTIGPITAARTGITTADVGAPQLAMHSARELMAAGDVPSYAGALAAFLAGPR